jgi:hypothetical protein
VTLAAEPLLVDQRAEPKWLRAILAAERLVVDQRAEPKWLLAIHVQVLLDQAADAKLRRRRSAAAILFRDFSRE